VTAGADGAYAVGADGVRWRAAGWRLPVVDTIGAGDTFTAAYLYWTGVRGGSGGGGDAVRGGGRGDHVYPGGAQPPSAAEVDALLAGGRSPARRGSVGMRP